MLSPRVLVLAVFISSSSGCIPTVTPDDMYEDEMTTTFSSIVMTSAFVEPQSTAPETTMTTSTSTTSTTTTTTTSPTTTTTTTTNTGTTACATCTCPSGGVLFGTTCYTTDPSASGWNFVGSYCTSSYGAASTPPIINSPEENDFVFSLFNGVPPANRNMDDQIPYLSLTRATGSDPYMWTDGSSIAYTNWVGGVTPPNDPTKLCAKMLLTTGEWEPVPCNVSGNRSCEYPATMSG